MNARTQEQPNLLFDFSVDKAAKMVHITREFAAPLPLVWDAFTKQELLDQWWAPKPFASKTKVMDFKVGGRRFYAMVGPDGHESWAIQKYTSINPKTNFKLFNAFADKDENPQLPGSDWNLTFSEHSGGDGNRITRVSISVYNESLERMEMLMEGFKGGMTSTMKQLEALLASMNS